MVCYFIANQQSDYFNTPTFMSILQFTQHNPQICSIKEKQRKSGLKLLLTFKQITSVQKALAVFKNI